MASYQNLSVSTIHETGKYEPRFPHRVNLRVDYDPQGLNISFSKCGNKDPLATPVALFETLIDKTSPPLKVGRTGFVISTETDALFLKMSTENDAAAFQIQITKALKGNDSSLFAERTEESSALQYFQFYGYLSQQQNMMQDYIRTATYHKAIISNLKDFQDKVILDVGAGSGILSFFAAHAGAKKVYAVEASSMAIHAEALAAANGLSGKLIVIPGKIEEVELPEKVDAIISEPMGYMLYNERMLETYLHAKKWLKPGGKMYPSKGDLHVTPFSDEALYMEQVNKAMFWQQNCFHGVDLGTLYGAAIKEYFRQPVVDTFDIRICLAQTVKHTVDFMTATEFDLHQISIPLDFTILESGTCHGLAFWFDVAFEGSTTPVWLSTSPTEPLTHWYQVRCLIENPFLVKQGQSLKGKVVLTANKRQSYDVLIELEGENIKATNTLDLKNPYFRYTGQPPQPPPGQHNVSPSDKIWTLDNGNLVNGLQINGSIVDGMSTLVEMPQSVMIPTGSVQHQMQANASVTHYTAVPLMGDFMAAQSGGQPQSVLLTNSNVNVLPASHNINWQH